MNTKKEIPIPEELPQECKSASGRTVGLIDSLISIANVLVTDDFLYQDGIEDALADLRSSDNMKRLMNIGELSDAKDYIKRQQEQIDLLSGAISELSRHLHTQSVEGMRWVNASERMPNKDEVGKLVHIKPIKEQWDFYMFLKYVRDFDVGETASFKWNLWDGYHGWTMKITPELLSKIEWLEEPLK